MGNMQHMSNKSKISQNDNLLWWKIACLDRCYANGLGRVELLGLWHSHEMDVYWWRHQWLSFAFFVVLFLCPGLCFSGIIQICMLEWNIMVFFSIWAWARFWGWDRCSYSSLMLSLYVRLMKRCVIVGGCSCLKGCWGLGLFYILKSIAIGG